MTCRVTSHSSRGVCQPPRARPQVRRDIPGGRGGGAAVTCVSRWVWTPSSLVCEAGRLRLTWTRVRCADRGLPCGRRLAAWTRVCCVDTGRGSACGGRSDV